MSFKAGSESVTEAVAAVGLDSGSWMAASTFLSPLNCSGITCLCSTSLNQCLHITIHRVAAFQARTEGPMPADLHGTCMENILKDLCSVMNTLLSMSCFFLALGTMRMSSRRTCE